MFSQNTAYELVNSLAGCCNYWQGLFERGAHHVLTTIDPWYERKAAIQDYLDYISLIDEDSYE